MASRNGHCDLLEFEDHYPEYFEADNVVTLSQADICRILADYIDRLRANAARDRKVLDRLGKISPSVASKFTLKTAILPQLKFRLVTKQKCQSNNIPSFVALSYCRSVRSPRELKVSAGAEASKFRLPVSAILSKAVAQELEDAEGIWCDQLCISQADLAEMTVTLGLMDGIYNSARIVVILLDDIEINEEEAEFLGLYGPEFARRPKHTEGQTPPFMLTHAVFARLYLKIVGCQWFERAWCSHELCMSRAYVVLAPCAGPRPTVFRFSREFMSHMLELWNQVRYQALKSPSVRRIDGATGTIATGGNGRQISVLLAWANMLCLKAGGVPLLGRALRQQSAMQDKFIICLNVSASGLGVSGAAYHDATTRRLPEEEWLYRLTALAFSQRHPTALCTSGSFIFVPSRDSKKSWIQVPKRNDVLLEAEGAFELMEGEYRFHAGEFGRYIQLPIILASQSWVLHEPCEISTCMALTIMETCKQLGHGLGTNLYWSSKQHSSRINDAGKRLAARCLGCILACGVSWMAQTMAQQHRYFYSRERIIADRCLGLYSRQGPTFLNIQLFKSVQHLAGSSFKAELTSWMLSSLDNHMVIEYLVHIAHFLALISLPEGFDTTDVQRFSPHIARSAAHAPLLLVMPDEYKSSTIAVPAELADDKFARMNRAWVLEECEDKTASPETGYASFHLQGKMRLFGPSISTLYPRTTMARVYGPHCVDNDH